MRVHHLNCGTMCPRGARLLHGCGGLLEPARLVCHCLLVESDDGLILVDTGVGLDDVAQPRARLGSGFVALTRPRCDPEETAARQVQRLGFRIADVRHIVVTHLDLDHAGGLPDFPAARVHVFAREHAAAMHPRPLERARYRRVHWAHEPQWEIHALAGERWFGFGAVRALEGAGPDVLLVPLHGHTRGHCGVAVRTSEGWLLHAGDAYFDHGEMDPDRPRCTPGLDFFQRVVEVDRDARLHNQQRLRELVRDHGGEIRVMCAHSPEEFERALATSRPGDPAHAPSPTTAQGIDHRAGEGGRIA
jgi:glyoxylase-like metal-dependent hydrolase (beta-lactamase superfamily II)